jgi:hypothetical protein
LGTELFDVCPEAVSALVPLEAVPFVLPFFLNFGSPKNGRFVDFSDFSFSCLLVLALLLTWKRALISSQGVLTSA